MTEQELSADEVLERVASDYLERIRCGERPRVSDYVAQYPSHANEIPQIIRTLDLVEELPDGTVENPREETTFERIGDYRIVREIGRGGMGIVFEAVQESLGRRVALKVVPKNWIQGDEASLRFQQEARATARMHHSNIVPVFEVGNEDGNLYFAMQLIVGVSLHELIQSRTDSNRSLSTIVSGPDRRGQKETGQREAGRRDAANGMPGAALEYSVAASYCLQACEAIDYAHCRKIIHRDIKPSNLLLDDSGVVWVADFGIAKTEGSQLTETGDLVGTLRYVSPERFKGQCDERADIYALGLTLYELLTCRPAFVGDDRLQLIRAISASTPLTPRRIDPQIPRDLETIVMKAIEKEPEERYSSARAFANDLRCFLEDRAIAARRPTATETLVRFCRRNPRLARAVATIALLLMGLLAVVSYSAFHFRNAEVVQRELANEVRKESGRARAAELTMQQQLYCAQMISASKSLSELGGIAQVRSATDLWRPAVAGRDLRGWEWFYLQSVCERSSIDLQGHSRFAWSVEWRPDGGRVASVGTDGGVSISDPDTGVELKRWFVEGGQARSVCWSPDGTKLAVAHGNAISVFEASSGTRLQHMPGAHGGEVACLHWEQDGGRIASVSLDGAIKTWDAATGMEIATFVSGARTEFYTVAWRPDGSLLATGGQGADVQLTDTRTGRRRHKHRAHSSATTSLDFSPDGVWLVTGGRDRSIRVSRVSDGSGAFSMLTPCTVLSVKWSHDGKYLAAGLWDGTVRVYRPDIRQEVKTMYGHGDRVMSVSWNDDDSKIASAAGNGEVKIFTLTEPADSSVHADRSRNAGLASGVWSPAEDRFALGSANEVLIWNPMEQEPARCEGHVRSIWGVDWSHDGRMLVSTAKNEPPQIWDAESCRSVRKLETGQGGARVAAWSPDDKLIAIANGDALTVWDAETGVVVRRMSRHGDPIEDLDWSPDGSKIATGGVEAVVRIYDVSSGDLISEHHNHRDLISSVCWSPDGRFIASGGYDKSIRIWDVAKEAETFVLLGHSRPVHCLTWHPHEARLASGGLGANIRIWDTEFGAQVMSLQSHRINVRSVDWNADGTKLLSTSWDKTIRVWDATRGYGGESR